MVCHPDAAINQQTVWQDDSAAQEDLRHHVDDCTRLHQGRGSPPANRVAGNSKRAKCAFGRLPALPITSNETPVCYVAVEDSQAVRHLAIWPGDWVGTAMRTSLEKTADFQ